MAANTRTFSPPCSINQVITATNFNKLDTNGAYAPSRLNTASGYRLVTLQPLETVAATGGGTRICTVGLGSLSCANVSDDLYLYVPPLPDGHALAGLKIKFLPAGAHAAQPAVLPSITAYKVDVDGATTSIGTASYAWVDIATYEAGFTLTAALVHTVNETLTGYSHRVKVILESGANSVTGMQILSMAISMTMDTALGGTDNSFWLKV